jgi:hypothetical protein
MSSSGEPRSDPDPKSWYAAFDALRGLRPEIAEGLARSFPEFRNEILGRRTFGPEPTKEHARRAALSRASAEAVLAAVTVGLEEVLAVVKRRGKTLARARLGSGLAALVGSSGVIAAMLRDLPRRPLLFLLLLFLLSSLLWAVLSKDQTGGDGSIARLREDMISEVGALATVKGKLALGLARQKDDLLISIMEALNAISAKVMVARARLGLPLATLPAAAR